MTVQFCKKCLMPNTKPGLILDEKGVCQACNNYERRKTIDYKARWKELEQLADKYRSNDGANDCIITVSGGKDSHYQVYVFTRLLNMHPLLISVSDPFTHTKAGEHNFRNIADAFDCDLVALHQNPNLVRRMMKIAFEEMGSPTWPVDRAIYTFPIQEAIRRDIPLVVYGENVSFEYGGVQQAETPSAMRQIDNDVVKKKDWDFWFKHGVRKEEINMMLQPTQEAIDKAKLDPIFLSYFAKWDGYEHYQIAKRFGFRDIAHEWKREGFIEDYDQVDSYAYLVHPWLKYPKFGFARATDVSGYWIRSGKITLKEAAQLIKDHDHKLDQRALDDFLQFTGYTDEYFWYIVDKFYNRELFEKNGDDIWTLKNPSWRGII